MADTANSEKLVFGLGDPAVTERCSITGRLFEVGSGALSHADQSANFVREAQRAADIPKYESDAEARQRVRREMEKLGAPTSEIAAAVAKTVGGPEICVQTRRPFDCSNGCLTKTAQTRQFLNDLSPAEKAQRSAAAAALQAAEPAGRA
jgi:hypothetical protein